MNASDLAGLVLSHWRQEVPERSFASYLATAVEHRVVSSVSQDTFNKWRLDPLAHRVDVERTIAAIAASDPVIGDLLGRLSPSTPSTVLFDRPYELDSTIANSNESLCEMTSINERAGGVRLKSSSGPTSSTMFPALQPTCSAPTSITILFMGANPRDQTRLLLDQEVHDIDLALRQSEFREHFNLCQHWAVRVTEVQSYLHRHKPHILHFSGHGGPSGLYFESPTGVGIGRPVPGAALSRTFAQFKPRLRCVVLNACYSVEQGEAIAETIDCVIGMSDRIADRAAILFSSAFYQALAYGRDIQTACELGRAQLDLVGLPGQDLIQLLGRNPVSFLDSSC